MYIPSFRQLSQCVRWDENNDTIEIPAEVLAKMLKKKSIVDGIDLGHRARVTMDRAAFSSILELAATGGNYVDEAYYARENRDVAKSVASKEILNAAKHFYTHGYLEGRLPSAFVVDEIWYRKKNADVDTAVRQREFESATKHYYRDGYFEGRIPTLALEKDVTEWNALIARHAAFRITGAKHEATKGLAMASTARRTQELPLPRSTKK